MTTTTIKLPGGATATIGNCGNRVAASASRKLSLLPRQTVAGGTMLERRHAAVEVALRRRDETERT